MTTAADVATTTDESVTTADECAETTAGEGFVSAEGEADEPAGRQSRGGGGPDLPSLAPQSAASGGGLAMGYDAPWGTAWVRRELAIMMEKRMFGRPVDPEKLSVMSGVTAALRYNVTDLNSKMHFSMANNVYFTCSSDVSS